MGFFDKVKSALNIGGVKVEVTQVEDEFPITDTVMKGRYVLTSGADHEVLSVTSKVIGELKEEYFDEEGHADFSSEITLGEDVDDADNEVMGREFQYPYNIKKDETLEDSFNIIFDDTIEEKLAEEGATLDHYDFYVFVEADVKGTPLDPDGKKKFKVLP